nr:site-2 protease family protein [uncultured Blautia sp.]
MHPVLRDGVSMGTFQRENSAAVGYFIENAKGEEFEISRDLYKALLHADGTKPLNLPGKGKDIIPTLERLELVRTSRLEKEDEFNSLLSFPVSSKVKKLRPFCKVLNNLLPLVSIIVFLVGICCKKPYFIERQLNYIVLAGGILLSAILHEIGHFCAALAYGYEIYDLGIIIWGIVPAGAYVGLGEKKGKTNKRQEIQCNLAGIEVNMLLSGAFMMLSTVYSPIAFTFLCIGVANIMLAAENIVPSSGSDGESALSELLEVESIYDLAKKWLLNRKRRKKLFHSGKKGCIRLILFSYTLISKWIVLFGIWYTLYIFFWSPL